MNPKSPIPPKLAQRFLHWFLRKEIAEEVEGDLEEQFYAKLEETTIIKAKLDYWYQVLNYLRPFAVRKSKQVNSNQYIMLLNYFKISWRNLRKHKFYSSVSVFGLALGISCSYLIWLWVQNETGYDSHFKDSEDIYYVHLNTIYEGQIYTNPVTPVPLYEALKKDIPEVANAAILSWDYDYLINNREKLIKQTGIYASEDFFNIFDFQIVEGNPRKAIKSNQLVITKKTASKLFGSQSALDKSLIINEEKEYRVGAVIANIPENSSIQFDWALNFREIEQDWMQNWGNNGVKTYVRIHPNTKKDTAEANMKEIYGQYTNIEDTFPILQPLRDVYLYSKFENGIPIGGRIFYVHIFMAIAFLILLIACINYLNLSTAYSTKRAKEVGLRKVVGASKSSIVQQFISESILFTLIALIAAIVVIYLSLPTINNLLGTQIQMDFSDPSIALSILFLLIVTSTLSGSYPAFYVSSLQPSKILNKNSKNIISTNFIRKTLIVFQFSISVILFIGIMVVSKQLHYVNSVQTGLDRKEVFYISFEEYLKDKIVAFNQEALKSTHIHSLTTSNMLPIDIQASTTNLSLAHKNLDLLTGVSFMHIGYDFLKTMNIPLVDGRGFSKDIQSDANAYLINERAAEVLGMKNPVGKAIKSVNGEGNIIGVMKDFHLKSLHSPITPLILCLGPQFTQTHIFVKPQIGHLDEAIADVERLVKEFNPKYPFEYHFLDDDYEKLYKGENLVNHLIIYFGILAVLISCLGLLSLVSYTAEKRYKEIGIRKVFGASFTDIITALTQDVFKLIFISIIISIPFAWYATDLWLKSFTYKIEIQKWMFFVPGALIILIVLLTISYQTIKVALMNPIKSLKSE